MLINFKTLPGIILDDFLDVAPVGVPVNLLRFLEQLLELPPRRLAPLLPVLLLLGETDNFTKLLKKKGQLNQCCGCGMIYS